MYRYDVGLQGSIPEYRLTSTRQKHFTFHVLEEDRSEVVAIQFLGKAKYKGRLKLFVDNKDGSAHSIPIKPKVMDFLVNYCFRKSVFRLFMYHPVFFIGRDFQVYSVFSEAKGSPFFIRKHPKLTWKKLNQLYDKRCP